MGWSEREDGCLDGDGPADVFGDCFAAIAQESTQRTGALPSVVAVLHAFVDALNRDGLAAPFYAELSRVAALAVTRGSQRLWIDGSEAEPWMVAELYDTLGDVAERYIEACERPPILHELLHYVSINLADVAVANDAPWDIIGAGELLLADGRKPHDPLPAPEVAKRPTPQWRVEHPKFGAGIVVDDQGDRLTIEFATERRVVLRSFVARVD